MFFLLAGIPFGASVVGSAFKWGSRAVLAVQAFNFFSEAGAIAATHLFESDVDLNAESVIFPEYLTPRRFNNKPFSIDTRKVEGSNQEICSGRITIDGIDRELDEEGEYFYSEAEKSLVFAKKGLPLLKVSTADLPENSALVALGAQEKLSQPNETLIRNIFKENLIQPRPISAIDTNPKVKTKKVKENGIAVEVCLQVKEGNSYRNINPEGEYFVYDQKVVFLQYGCPRIEIQLGQEHSVLLGELRKKRGDKLSLKEEKDLREIIENKIKEKNEELLDKFMKGLPSKYRNAMQKLRDNQEQIEKERKNNKGIFDIFSERFNAFLDEKEMFQDDDILSKILKYKLKMTRFAERQKEGVAGKAEISSSRNKSGLSNEASEDWKKYGRLKELKAHKELLEKRIQNLKKLQTEMTKSRNSSRDIFAKVDKNNPKIALQGNEDNVSKEIHTQLTKKYSDVSWFRKQWMSFTGKLTSYKIVREAIAGNAMKESIEQAVSNEMGLKKEVQEEIVALRQEAESTAKKIEAVTALKRDIKEKNDKISNEAKKVHAGVLVLEQSIKEQNQKEEKLKEEIEDEKNRISERLKKVEADIANADSKLNTEEVTPVDPAKESIADSMSEDGKEKTQIENLLWDVARCEFEISKLAATLGDSGQLQSVKSISDQAGSFYNDAGNVLSIGVAVVMGEIGKAAGEFRENAALKLREVGLLSQKEEGIQNADFAQIEEQKKEDSIVQQLQEIANGILETVATKAGEAKEGIEAIVVGQELESINGGSKEIVRLEKKIARLEVAKSAIKEIECMEKERNDNFMINKKEADKKIREAEKPIDELEQVSQAKWKKIAKILTLSILAEMKKQGSALREANKEAKENPFLNENKLKKLYKNRQALGYLLPQGQDNVYLNQLVVELQNVSTEDGFEYVFKMNLLDRATNKASNLVSTLKGKMAEVEDVLGQLVELINGPQPYSEKVKKIKDLVSRLEALRDEVKDLTKDIQQLKEQAKKDREIAAEMLVKAEEMAQEIESSNQNIVEQSAHREMAAKELAAKKAQLTGWEKQRGDIHIKVEKLRVLREQLVQKQDELRSDVSAEHKKLLEIKSNLNAEKQTLLLEKQSLEETAQELSVKIQVLDEDVRNGTPLPEGYVQIRLEILNQKENKQAEIFEKHNILRDLSVQISENALQIAEVDEELEKLKPIESLIDLIDQYTRCVEGFNHKLDLIQKNLDKFSMDVKLSEYLDQEIKNIELLLEKIAEADNNLKKEGIYIEASTMDDIMNMIMKKIEAVKEEISSRKESEGTPNIQQQGLSAIQKNQMAIDNALVYMMGDAEKVRALQNHLDQAFSAGNRVKMEEFYNKIATIADGNKDKHAFIQDALMIRKAYDLFLIKHTVAQAKNRLIAIVQRIEELKQLHDPKLSSEIEKLNVQAQQEEVFIDKQLQKAKELLQLVLPELKPLVESVKEQKPGAKSDNQPRLLIQVDGYSLWNAEFKELLREVAYFPDFEKAIHGKKNAWSWDEALFNEFKELFVESTPVPVASSLATEAKSPNASSLDEKPISALMEQAMNSRMEPSSVVTEKGSTGLKYRGLTAGKEEADKTEVDNIEVDKSKSSNNPFDNDVAAAQKASPNPLAFFQPVPPQRVEESPKPSFIRRTLGKAAIAVSAVIMNAATWVGSLFEGGGAGLL